MRNNLPYELLVFGIITMVFSAAIYTVLTGELITNSKAPGKMLFGSFLLGSSIHLVFELVGLNESWCRKEFP